MWVQCLSVALALLVSCARADETPTDTCAAGLWGGLLEEWAVSAHDHGRQGRVMSLPPTKGYYVSDRIDLVPPPAPHAPHGLPAPDRLGYTQYDEWQASPPPPPGGKIVNKPPNHYMDHFRPSYSPPSPHQPIPLTQQWGAADRLDAAAPAPPQKKVSETDLYLLSAMEKLVYRADLMEKRLRKMEDTVHYLLVGKDTKPEPCAANFTRVGAGCYYFSAEAGDWKAASLRCRKMRTHLLELDSDDEKRALFSTLLADKRLRGTDFWTGGLNPGLLWIWAHSARPVLNNATITNSSHAAPAGPSSVVGDGRCLALVPDAARGGVLYRGQDCALRLRYVCELPEEKARESLSDDLERVARDLRAVAGAARRAKLVWSAP